MLDPHACKSFHVLLCHALLNLNPLLAETFPCGCHCVSHTNVDPPPLLVRRCGSDKHRIGFHYRTGIKTSKCFNCEAIGHESRDCPAPCGICGSAQHKSGYHLNDHLYVGKADDSGSASQAAKAGAKAVQPTAAAASKPSARGAGGAPRAGGRKGGA